MLQRRVLKELQMMEESPPPGIFVWPKENHLDAFEACIEGPLGTPYEKGSFFLDITLPERYPLEPPKIVFVTPIYHPNIDDHGRICLDTLTQGSKGTWGPHLNICVALKSIQLLLCDPNPSDPLMADISKEYLENRPLYLENARKRTLQHAMKRPTAEQTRKTATSTEHSRTVEVSPSPASVTPVATAISPPKQQSILKENKPHPTQSAASSSNVVAAKKAERSVAEEDEEEFFASSTKRRK